MKKIARTIKDFLLFTRVFIILKPFATLFKTISHFSLLSSWVSRVNGSGNLLINDFYVPGRDFDRRYKLYEKVGTSLNLSGARLNYMEFGVASGNSFKWWIKFNTNAESHFTGFDTFEGLPEDWGGYKKGAMSYGIPQIDDKRADFFKGLFQETLNPFIDKNLQLFDKSVNVIHLDADLFSATIFVLSQLYRFIKKGDIILFDELSVPNHEFQAYKIFTEAFGIKLKPIGAVNNFYQVAFIVE
jgi:O-methyltransferase